MFWEPSLNQALPRGAINVFLCDGTCCNSQCDRCGSTTIQPVKFIVEK